VLAYINVNLHQPIRPKDLSDESNLSPFHFSRLFEEMTGPGLPEAPTPE
jgi:AraC-like DNA-binding protein